MTFINYASREINCKIVYYGPGLCGKTTNLQYIYDSTAPQAKGKLISLATETDRTLFFDFMPLELGTVRGFKTRFHLYTVPGQVYYDASRKLILRASTALFLSPTARKNGWTRISNRSITSKKIFRRKATICRSPLCTAAQQTRSAECHTDRRSIGELQQKRRTGFRGGRIEGTGVFDTLKAVAKQVLTELRKS